MSATHRYDDMIDRPHHVSSVHPPMPMASRAAQFSPFAALTGYEAVIAETARLTEEKAEPAEEQKQLIDRQLRLLRAHMADAPVVRVRYFRPDERKAGGQYRTLEGTPERIDGLAGLLLLGGEAIPFEDICSLQSELFTRFGDGE